MTRVIYAACDEDYYKDHGQYMMQSALDQGEIVHIDVINGNISTKETNGIVCNVRAATIPHNLDKRTFYACFRFLRTASILREYDEILIVDADGLFRKPVEWDYFKDSDLALFFRDPLPNVNEWEREGSRIAAGAVYARNTSISYWDEVGELMRQLGLRWFVDQYALYATYKRFEEQGAIKCIQMPDKYIDWNMRDDSIVWTGKGNRKFTDVTYLKEKKKYQ